MSVQMMSLIIERCAQTLEEVVVPQVSGSYAAAQASAVAQLLKTLAPAVELKGHVLREENEAMSSVLRAVYEQLSATPASASHGHLLEDMNASLTATADAACNPSEANFRLKGLLVGTIAALDALETVLSETLLQPLRQRIRIVLRQQLDNELAHFTLPV